MGAVLSTRAAVPDSMGVLVVCFWGCLLPLCALVTCRRASRSFERAS
jgi:hypothetical protein